MKKIFGLALAASLIFAQQSAQAFLLQKSGSDKYIQVFEKETRTKKDGAKAGGGYAIKETSEIGRASAFSLSYSAKDKVYTLSTLYGESHVWIRLGKGGGATPCLAIDGSGDFTVTPTPTEFKDDKLRGSTITITTAGKSVKYTIVTW